MRFRLLQAYQGEVSRELDLLIQQMVALDPSHRPRSMGEVQMQLKQIAALTRNQGGKQQKDRPRYEGSEYLLPEHAAQGQIQLPLVAVAPGRL
jgi:hypothetical protein